MITFIETTSRELGVKTLQSMNVTLAMIHARGRRELNDDVPNMILHLGATRWHVPRASAATRGHDGDVLGAGDQEKLISAATQTTNEQLMREGGWSDNPVFSLLDTKHSKTNAVPLIISVQMHAWYVGFWCTIVYNECIDSHIHKLFEILQIRPRTVWLNNDYNFTI